jgi:periodic tryptophan protein 2
MDASVRVWDVMTGQLLRTLRGHAGPTTAVAFGADGWHVISGSYDRTVRIWELV